MKMHAFILLALPALALAAPAPVPSATPTAINTTQEYRLKTQLKTCSADKLQYDGLYLHGYHIGAGESDATFSSNTTYAAIGFLNVTNTTAAGNKVYSQEFDFGTAPYPWSLDVILSAVFYSAWQPTRINIGYPSSGSQGSSFFINETGLQWTSDVDGIQTDEFGGWLVCDWWHSEPQLFVRINYYNDAAVIPSSCADVDLIPEYI